jgi:hypothetical protein
MSRRLITLRNEDDLLALIPYTLGFVPEDSLVLVTLAADASPFHARIDLPDDPALLPDVVAPLVVAARRNGATRAMAVVYTGDPCLADAAADLLFDALDGGGVACLVALRADGQRWYPLGLDHLDHLSVLGVPYDTRDHPLSSQAVLDGRVTFRSRSELADSLSATDPDDVDAVLEAHRRLEHPGAPVPRRLLAAEAAWLTGAADRALAGARPLPAGEVARMLRAVSWQEVRDALWGAMHREDAPAHVRVWRDVVRRSPEELVAPAAGLLAFAAWLAGDGALAWCAVERSLRADPDQRLAQLVAQALDGAVPPSTWQPVDPVPLDLDAG